MILKGNQRGGGKQMALHLLNGDKNEHVSVHEVSGFVASDVIGALNEAYALSKGTKCKQFMYSLSLSPPANEDVPVSVYEAAMKRIEKKLNLIGQPRVVVFHEKEGRRHAHCVWSRIDTDKMKAINISHPKLKLNTIAKSLYLEHGWQMPDGFRDKSRKNPLNYTRAEWQQAARTGQSPKAIKATLQECWVVSDERKEFEQALQECGYYLAKGDRRGYVAVDIHGEVYSLTRQLRVKKKDLQERLGNSETLPPVSKVKDKISGQLSDMFKNFLDEQNKDHQKELSPLLKAKHAMTLQHRKDRAAQKYFQEKRWQSEELKRSAKIRSGFKGIWDKLNGRYWKSRKQNEQETAHCHTRDQKERETLITTQLYMRQNLQMQLNQVKTKHENNRQHLIRDLSHLTKNDQAKGRNVPEFSKLKEQIPTRSQPQQRNHKGRDNPDIDMEPEI
jgi:hypothetical protein